MTEKDDDDEDCPSQLASCVGKMNASQPAQMKSVSGEQEVSSWANSLLCPSSDKGLGTTLPEFTLPWAAFCLPVDPLLCLLDLPYCTSLKIEKRKGVYSKSLLHKLVLSSDLDSFYKTPLMAHLRLQMPSTLLSHATVSAARRRNSTQEVLECFTAFGETYCDASECVGQEGLNLTEPELLDSFLDRTVLSVTTDGGRERSVASADLPPVLCFVCICTALSDCGVGGCDGGEEGGGGDKDGVGGDGGDVDGGGVSGGDECGSGGAGHGGVADGDYGCSKGHGESDGGNNGGGERGGGDGGDGGGGAGDSNDDSDDDDDDSDGDDGYYDDVDGDSDDDSDNEDGDDDEDDDDDDDSDGEDDDSDDDGGGDGNNEENEDEDKSDANIILDENNSILLHESTLQQATPLGHFSGSAASLSSGQCCSGSLSFVGSDIPVPCVSAQLNPSAARKAAPPETGRFSVDDCRRWRSCRKCMLRKWKVVFIPCGHLSCWSCSVVNRPCIFCGVRVENTNAVWLSNE